MKRTHHVRARVNLSPIVHQVMSSIGSSNTSEVEISLASLEYLSSEKDEYPADCPPSSGADSYKSCNVEGALSSCSGGRESLRLVGTNKLSDIVS
jgi:hypothetical protein